MVECFIPVSVGKYECLDHLADVQCISASSVSLVRYILVPFLALMRQLNGLHVTKK